MAVSAVAAAVDNQFILIGWSVGLFRGCRRECEPPVFIVKKRPEMIFSIKVRLAILVFICSVDGINLFKKVPVPFGCNIPIAFFIPLAVTGGNITGKGIHLRFGRDNSINDRRNLVDVCTADRCHNHACYAGIIDNFDFFQRCLKTAGLSEPIMRVFHTVDTHLVLIAAVIAHFSAYFICQMEWISHQREGDIMLLH